MSLIGPRPTVAVAGRPVHPRQRGRLAVKPGITGWAQVNGRASLPWAERIELDLFYIAHRSLSLDLKILWRTRRDGPRRLGPVQGRRPAAGRESCEPAGRSSDRRGQALRHRLLLCPPHDDRRRRPLPAGSRAVRRARARVGPADRRPRLRPRARAPVRAARRGRRAAADRPRHRGARPRPRRRAPARASCPPRDRARDLRQVRDPPAAGAAVAALAADCAAGGGPGRARLPGDGQAAPRLRRALDPPRPRRLAGALLRRLRLRARDGAAGDGRPRALDRLPRRSRRPLFERDSAHDARVARGRVDQGPGHPTTTS